ncbi:MULTISPECIES: glucosyl-3-phosphoglycerate synthase [Methanohalophilus]|jgi:glucosyl-3-phosphoglycerate synthase|uniref:Glucosyl-3-phosphoglycerate synthase n=1 Tax=Methanohalophilus euhalobius TaxID=51203 RepID=A0A315A2F4_9EURY|nr:MULTISPECIES: glucosyl-3-phosphoglycerate synthase [Methanohalophilus]KXS43531.1 MAG: glycosyltransferase involved in cell wall bioproteini [Methanohalophilus sp. T328-1]OBZ34861.1 MAG: glucosyl-3-phosphoglycerate synthase [Methanohalophilus sp. DAL1]PQV43764.1 glucosyl-3-phosphoglycerate synthase [Methanohalophilus euhalobius]RNI12753.1 glucosyl-3-phosphoglycerate synthase [Methanohalophilus euhalobius]
MDFHQEDITTIHDFCIDVNKLEEKIKQLEQKRPACLIIPILYEEVEKLPLQQIVEALNKCDCIKQIIIPMAADNPEQYRKAAQFFSQLKTDHMLIWCNGKRVQKIIDDMKEIDLDLTGFRGKGMDAWLGLGVASLNSYAIALHDADIVNYTSAIPLKLLYPIVSRDLNFFFNKGYYARINQDKKTMHGRVYRLFVQPLMNTLHKERWCDSDILDYFRSFRYTLSGEFAMTSDLALNIRIPADWGLEVGLLAEVYNNATFKRVCQTDLGFYDHKHKELGHDRTEGLCKMTGDIFSTLLRIITESSTTPISHSLLHSIQVKYKRRGQDIIRKYYTDALFNGLNFNRHEEETYVDMFSKVIMKSGEEYIDKPHNMLLPDWTRVLSAIPDLREQICYAAREDAREFYGNVF